VGRRTQDQQPQGVTTEDRAQKRQERRRRTGRRVGAKM